jgi:hypothetical protein
MHDTLVLRDRVPTFLRFVGAAANEPSLADALEGAAVKLGESVVDAREIYCGRLVQACSEVLQRCGNIPRQYRHTGRKAPTEPTDFVSKVFDSVVEFRSTASGGIVEDLQGEWEIPVVTAVTAKYKDLISQLLVSSKEMEEKLQRVKKLRKGNKVTGMTDDDKIRLQLWLDVKAYRETVGRTSLRVMSNIHLLAGSRVAFVGSFLPLSLSRLIENHSPAYHRKSGERPHPTQPRDPRLTGRAAGSRGRMQASRGRRHRCCNLCLASQPRAILHRVCVRNRIIIRSWIEMGRVVSKLQSTVV